MLPPDDEDTDPTRWDSPHRYAVDRGTCPRCDSTEVTHYTIGMPAGPHVYDHYPDWVHPVGCVVPLFLRACNACGLGWNVDPDAGGMIIETESQLLELANVSTVEEFGSWVDNRLELTAWAHHCPDTEDLLVVHIHNGGAILDDFPMTLANFWDYVNSVEDAELEASTDDD